MKISAELDNVACACNSNKERINSQLSVRMQNKEFIEVTFSFVYRLLSERFKKALLEALKKKKKGQSDLWCQTGVRNSEQHVQPWSARTTAAEGHVRYERCEEYLSTEICLFFISNSQSPSTFSTGNSRPESGWNRWRSWTVPVPSKLIGSI